MADPDKDRDEYQETMDHMSEAYEPQEGDSNKEGDYLEDKYDDADD